MPVVELWFLTVDDRLHNGWPRGTSTRFTSLCPPRLIASRRCRPGVHAVLHGDPIARVHNVCCMLDRPKRSGGGARIGVIPARGHVMADAATGIAGSRPAAAPVSGGGPTMSSSCWPPQCDQHGRQAAAQRQDAEREESHGARSDASTSALSIPASRARLPGLTAGDCHQFWYARALQRPGVRTTPSKSTARTPRCHTPTPRARTPSRQVEVERRGVDDPRIGALQVSAHRQALSHRLVCTAFVEYVPGERLPRVQPLRTTRRPSRPDTEDVVRNHDAVRWGVALDDLPVAVLVRGAEVLFTIVNPLVTAPLPL